MATSNKIAITNFRQVLAHLERLDMSNNENVKSVRKFLKTPFLKMRRESKKNLSSQKSMNSGNLYRGLSVGSKFKKSKGYFSVAFGGRGLSTEGKKATNHFHLVNSGTVKRKHKSGKNVGSVGKRMVMRSNSNPSFKLGFADKAIKPNIPTKGYLVSKFNELVLKVKTPGV